MGMDFHDEKNRSTYTTRKADPSWLEAMNNLLSFEHVSSALDIGCGGGIYSKALVDLGADSVTGLDFSEVSLEGARENCKSYTNITFSKGNALETGLEANSYNLILERALIHHIKDLNSCFKEAYKLLKPGGQLIIQDRTPKDCFLPGDSTHIRGYLFELFPQLIQKEKGRRHDSDTVISALMDNRFHDIEEVKLWETRNIYHDKKELLDDLLARTGRSILHELDDQELNQLVDYIDKVLPDTNIIEKDRWTIWKAVK
ncbi:class I SAM-dependent methyltransferase [Cytobacillus sp. FJAT-54145]|uniref:Class I SAM-dependent methyltransferase n=1 Tax=Cytobacillus spartinae TaxID=3299023 RepID=A0ABW6K7F6_9BACI